MEKSNIIDYMEHIEENTPHKFSEVICVHCGYRWISVRPVGVLLRELQCKNCGPGFVIETGEVMENDL